MYLAKLCLPLHYPLSLLRHNYRGLQEAPLLSLQRVCSDIILVPDAVHVHVIMVVMVMCYVYSVCVCVCVCMHNHTQSIAHTLATVATSFHGRSGTCLLYMYLAIKITSLPHYLVIESRQNKEFG